MTGDDRLFEEAFHGELERLHTAHPAFSMLYEYATSKLEPTLAEKVSVHIASCSRCAGELAEIRRENRALLEGMLHLLPDPLERLTPERGVRWKELLRGWSEWLAAPKVFRRHALAYVTVGVLLVALNVWMNRQPRLLGAGEQEWWALWVLAPWGVLLVMHGVRSLFRSRKL